MPGPCTPVQTTNTMVYFANFPVFELMLAWGVSYQVGFFSDNKTWLYYAHIIAQEVTGFHTINIPHNRVTNSAV